MTIARQRSARETAGCVAVVPARNAGKWIEKCLRGLSAAGFADDERIVVDDGSTDATGEIARSLGARVLRADRNQGAAAARNLAAASSGANLLFFVDADVVVAPDSRERVLAAFSDPDVDAVFGAYDTSPECRNAVSQYRNLLHHYVHVNGPSRPGTFWTGCGAVRRTSFERIGGFDIGQRMMEDVDFGMRLVAARGIVVLDPKLQGKHLKSWTVASMARTDLHDRAIPWSRLMLADGAELSNELNLGPTHRSSAILTMAMPFTFGLGFLVPEAWGLTALVIAAFIALNWSFLGFLVRNAGWRVAITAIPLHLLHYTCAVAGFGWVLLTDASPRRLKALFSNRASATRRSTSNF